MARQIGCPGSRIGAGGESSLRIRQKFQKKFRMTAGLSSKEQSVREAEGFRKPILHIVPPRHQPLSSSSPIFVRATRSRPRRLMKDT